MQQVIVNRRDAEAERSEEALEKAHSRWIQTEYPVTFAEQLFDSWQKTSQKYKADTSATLRMYFATRHGHMFLSSRLVAD